MTESSFNFKDWYGQHGGKLNKHRRGRYQEDPEYRERVLELNRKSREKRRERQLVEHGAEAAAQKLEPRVQPWKVVKVALENGRIVAELTTIGSLARALGVSVQAVRLWEKQGVLPPTPLRSKKGDRLYSREYIETAQKIRESQGRLPTTTREGFRPRAWMGAFKMKGGKERKVVVYRIGSLAYALRRTVVTVEQMEQKNYLPETPFRAASTGYRLYTADMIAAVKAAMDARGGIIRGEEKWRDFYAEVVQAWTDAGVMGATLLSLEALPNQPSSEE